MKRLTAPIMAMALAFTVTAHGDQNDEMKSGYVDYLSVGTLEIGIDGALYRIDGSTAIIGAESDDMIEALDEIPIGTGVTYSTRSDNRGAVIRELRLQRL